MPSRRTGRRQTLFLTDAVVAINIGSGQSGDGNSTVRMRIPCVFPARTRIVSGASRLSDVARSDYIGNSHISSLSHSRGAPHSAAKSATFAQKSQHFALKQRKFAAKFAAAGNSPVADCSQLKNFASCLSTARMCTVEELRLGKTPNQSPSQFRPANSVFI
jgi:hypothetical protein